MPLRPDSRDQTVTELLFKQMEDGVCLLNNLKEVDLRLTFGISQWYGCNGGRKDEMLKVEGMIPDSTDWNPAYLGDLIPGHIPYVQSASTALEYQRSGWRYLGGQSLKKAESQIRAKT